MSYDIQNNRSYKVNDEDGERTLLANFTAVITRETRYIDGVNTETFLTIEGLTPNLEDNDAPPTVLPPVEIPAGNFGGLTWVMPSWGVRAVIQPGGSIKEDLRTSIQLRSRPITRNVYRHIGWTKLNGQNAYLHASGAITSKGNDRTVEVQLAPELSRYDLSNESNVADAIRATIDLVQVAPPNVSWPLLAGCLSPVYSPIDFAIHLTGRTGTFKSEFMSLFQSHYGTRMDARHLPGSWSSTANALEAQAFFAANAAFVIDDFVPSGTSYQQRAYQTNADKLFRSQGNQSGRARLTDTSHLQTTMYPRGIILSTGEDTPEGHSVRARMLILELSPGDISVERLTAAQKQRPYYSATTAALINYLSAHPNTLKQRSDFLRAENQTIGHTRTPSMLGRLIATVEHFLVFAQLSEAITQAEREAYTKEATAAIIQAGEEQHHYLEAADPVDLFTAAIRQALGAGLGHFRTLNGGIPTNPTTLGYQSERSSGEMETYKSRGPCLGWVKWADDEMFLEINSGFSVIKKVAGNDMPLTKQTIMKRLKESGLLSRSDDSRQRNTIRITAEGHPRQVLCLSLTTVLDTQEIPSHENQDADARSID